jgi:DNA-binding transcriptional regulator YiaG
MKYKSEIYEVIHRGAAANFEVGAISADRMREYDEGCLVPEPEPAQDAEKSPETGHFSPAAAGI